jgi:hypothetical protein
MIQPTLWKVLLFLPAPGCAHAAEKVDQIMSVANSSQLFGGPHQGHVAEGFVNNRTVVVGCQVAVDVVQRFV